MEIDTKNHTLSLLINYTDRRLSNPALQKILTDDLRKVKKEEGEGVASSVHITLSLQPNKEGNYIGIVEYVPGLSKMIYLRLLNSLFRTYSTDVVLDKKTNKGKKCHPKIESRVFEGNGLNDALAYKPLKGIELIRYDSKLSDIDENDKVIPSVQKVYLTPKEDTLGAKAQSIITEYAKLGKDKKYSKMRIEFKKRVWRYYKYSD